MNFKSKITAGLLAAAIAATALGGAVQESRAGGLSPAEAAAIAGVGGLIVGGLIVGSAHRHHGHHHVGGGYGWNAHVARCAARYRSYDPYSDTYLGYDGYRHYCRL